MRNGGTAAATGDLGLKVVRDGVVFSPETIRRHAIDLPAQKLPTVTEILMEGAPQKGLPDEVNAWRLKNLRHLWRGFRQVQLARLLDLPIIFGALRLEVFRADGSHLNLGLASLRVVTTAGVGFIVDAFQNLTEVENLKYHAIGTGTNAEASGDTSLQTELTTQYNPDNTRATGTTTEIAANIYRTVGTNAVDSAVAVTEHGILSQAATGGGTLLDRSVFSAVNLALGDSLQSTYDATFPAGG